MGQGQRQVSQGGPVVALTVDPMPFFVWGPIPATRWQREKENLQSWEGDSRRSFLLITVEISHAMLCLQITHHSWPASHEEQEPAWTHKRYWIIDEQPVLSLQGSINDSLEGNIKDKLVNEPKPEFTWSKQTTCVLPAEVSFSKLIVVFDFHLMFDSDWFRAHRDHYLLWQLFRFTSCFSCPVPQPKHATSSSCPFPL